jgi:hypothetical protein
MKRNKRSEPRYKVGDRVVIKIRPDARPESLDQVGPYANKALVIKSVDNDPSNPSWGGKWHGPYYHFNEFSSGLNESWLSDKLIKIEEILR